MVDKSEKTLWVTSIQPEKINGESYIPTVVYYDGGKPKIGFDALKSSELSLDINREFKVELGNVLPGGSIENRKKFHTASGGNKSAYEISMNYIDSLLENIENKFHKSEETGYKFPVKIMVAEPLSFQDKESSKRWSANYRKNIKTILNRYEEVDFLPEPFAVYQYYRYGQRIPHLQDRSKHIAFIIDFGGGTFDACVIESKESGDISEGGKHSRPLSADSVPVGGFYINREVAAYLLKRNVADNRKGDADKFYKLYLRVLKGELTSDALNKEAQAYIRNISKLELKIEIWKIELSIKISNWGLDCDAYEKIMVDVAKNPFIDDENISIEFYSHQFRDIYIKEIWNKKLMPVVKNVIRVAKERLDEKEISITLISGGSSNIRWLQELLKRDFFEDLGHAEPVPISHSFQEVVANGLAIECARRFYSDDSEFVSVTYNPIKLFLDPDGSGVENDKRFKSVNDKIDMSLAKQCDLIPSAQSLKNFFNEEIRWKVKLKKSPKQYLEYFFLRPKSEGGDSYYNVEETRVQTRDSANFDNHVTVSLIIREDGTAEPKFIYKSPNEGFSAIENSVQGRAFYIDMTADSQSTVKRPYYVGLDFGTSNSSVCLLSQDKIRMTGSQQSKSLWAGISKVLFDLPFPVALSVRKFMGTYDARSGAEAAREAFEASLAFMAYYAAAEASHKGLLAGSMKQFQHRSLGPLMNLLEQSLRSLGNNAVHCAGFNDVILKQKDKFSEACAAFTKNKHQKLAADDINWHDYVELAVKALLDGMKNQVFGYFTTSEEVAFSDGEHNGLFISAKDNYPFVDKYKIISNKNFSRNIAFVIDKNLNKAISLSPFYFWWERKNSSLSHACYMIDKYVDIENIDIKPIDEESVYSASGVNNSLARAIDALFTEGKSTGGIYDVSSVIKC